MPYDEAIVLMETLIAYAELLEELAESNLHLTEIENSGEVNKL